MVQSPPTKPFNILGNHKYYNANPQKGIPRICQTYDAIPTPYHHHTGYRTETLPTPYQHPDRTRTDTGTGDQPTPNRVDSNGHPPHKWSHMGKWHAMLRKLIQASLVQGHGFWGKLWGKYGVNYGVNMGIIPGQLRIQQAAWCPYQADWELIMG